MSFVSWVSKDTVRTCMQQEEILPPNRCWNKNKNKKTFNFILFKNPKSDWVVNSEHSNHFLRWKKKYENIEKLHEMISSPINKTELSTDKIFEGNKKRQKMVIKD